MKPISFKDGLVTVLPLFLLIVALLCLFGAAPRRAKPIERFMAKVYQCHKADANGIFKDATSRSQRKVIALKQLGIAMDELRGMDWGADNGMPNKTGREIAEVVGAIMYDLWIEFEKGK